jgi:tetratricopeptide (TPR) repeat protein
MAATPPPHDSAAAPQQSTFAAAATAPPAPVPTAEPPGYDLIGEIGRGAMGVVYRAVDRSLQREVAVKVLQERFAQDAAATRRFLDEARITGQLQHPGIPAIYQVGALADGRPFLAMKLIKGQTLAALLKDRPPGGPAAMHWLAIFEAICQAVGYAHAHNIIHRDLKPSNIMVGSFGETQVMDWGLAKILGRGPTTAIKTATSGEETVGTVIHPQQDTGSQTIAGSMLGTPAYMPPEQAAGEIGRIDQRSDVFGLGAILCVILTGQPPFVGKDLESVRLSAVRGKLGDALARLEVCCAEPEWIALATRCLEFEPDDRPAHAGELARTVATLRASAEARARRAELDCARAEVQAAEQRKRRRVQLALGATLLGLLALVGGGAWYADRLAAEKQVEAARTRQAAEAALDQADAALRQDNPALGEIDAALTQAANRLADGTGATADLVPRLEQLTKDRRMLQRLDEIDQRRWLASDDRQRLNVDYALTQLPRAFRDYGLDLDAEAPTAFAAKVRAATIARRLEAALNTWLEASGSAKLLAVLQALDPDPERRDLRAAFAVGDVEQIAQRTAKLDGRKLPAEFAQLVGAHPLTPQAQAIRILTAAQAAHPNHFGLANQTARRFLDEQPTEKIMYYRIALALRPTNTICWTNLGSALHTKKEWDAAIAAYQEAARLDPKFARPHAGLGIVFEAKKDLDGAIAAYKEALRLDPKYAMVHNNLGNVLRDKKDLEGAAASYREAMKADPSFALPHFNLGNLFRDQKKDVDAAIGEFEAATRLDPNLAGAWNNLAQARLEKKDVDGAIVALKETVRTAPKFLFGHNKLGELLCGRGEPMAALAVLRQGIKVNPEWLGNSATLVRYNLACCACLAAAGARDSPPESERPALRAEALAWLTADLAFWRKAAEVGQNRPLVHQQMRHWLDDGDLVSVRDEQRLPVAERAAWKKLWDEVRKLRDETAPK